MKDYYIILGVSRGVDLDKIKQAYRKGVKKYHPDTARSAETTERFLEIKEAYETLSNEEKRREYDRQLERERSSIRISRPLDIIKQRRSVYDKFNSFGSLVDEFFSGFVPGFFDQSIGTRKDLYLELILSPQEAAEGGLFPIRVPVVEPCPRCNRSGLFQDFFCPECYGYGRIRAEREIRLSVPPHIIHGTEICLSLEDIGLRDTDLFITVSIAPEFEEIW
jgi:molecular chaperone DnaJ